jgi:hypothetical protein
VSRDNHVELGSFHALMQWAADSKGGEERGHWPEFPGSEVAWERAAEGYKPPPAEQSQRISFAGLPKELVTVTKMRTRWGVGGGAAWNMAQVISGGPRYALRFHKETQRGPAIRLCVDVFYSASVYAADADRRTLAIFQAIRALCASGRRVEVSAIIPSRMRRNGGSCSVTALLKPADRPLDGAALWTALNITTIRSVWFDAVRKAGSEGSIPHGQFESKNGAIYIPAVVCRDGQVAAQQIGDEIRKHLARNKQS